MVLASLVVAIVAITIAEAAGLGARGTTRHASGPHRERPAHEEVTAHLQDTCATDDADGPPAELTLELTGSAVLDRLDQETVGISNDVPDRAPHPGSHLSAAEITAVAQGPYRTNAGLRDIDESGRTYGRSRCGRNCPIRTR